MRSQRRFRPNVLTLVSNFFPPGAAREISDLLATVMAAHRSLEAD